MFSTVQYVSTGVEKHVKTLRLAFRWPILLERLTQDFKDMSSNLTDYTGTILGVSSFFSGDPDVIMSCLTCSTVSVWLRNSRSLACHWQTHLPIRWYWRELC
jgi:hypothetical protein